MKYFKNNRFTRYTCKFEVPIKFSNGPTFKGICFQTIIFGICFSLFAIIGFLKKKDKRKLKKLQKNNKIRLIEQKSTFNMFVNEIHQFSSKILSREKKLISKFFF